MARKEADVYFSDLWLLSSIASTFTPLLCVSTRALAIGAEVKKMNQAVVLHQQIQHDINEIGTDSTYTHIKYWSIAIAAVLIIVFVFGGISLFTNRQEPMIPESGNNPNIAGITDGLETLFATGRELTNIDGGIENPIQTELKNLVANTRSAASFLFACVDVDITYTNDNEEQK